MSLYKGSWLPAAEALQLLDGRSARVDHDCGPGRTLQISKEAGKLRAYCYRCNEAGMHTLAEPIADRIERLRRASIEDTKAQVASSMPQGSTAWSDWPDAGRLWFARAGLTAADAGKLGAYYSPILERVVLPCGGGFWQARSIDGRQPKYLAPVTDKVHPRYGEAADITLTEDILSAYKVGKAGGEGVCMLGTSLPQVILASILSRGCAVNIWLDNDAGVINRGQVAAKKIATQLRALGVPYRNIVTDQDPKLIHLHGIKEILCTTQ